MTIPIGRYEPYPNPYPKWEPRDDHEARKLGWYVDTIDCAIVAVHGAPAMRLHWSSDRAAVAFVGALALRGHPLAVRALEYIAMKTGVQQTADFIMKEGK